jgi:hypothetical protein
MKAPRKLQSLAALCAVGIGSVAVSQAMGGESLDRMGRLLGIGWSDGYHACREGCYEVGENLPPRGYAADHTHYASSRSYASHVHSHAPNGHCATCNQHAQPAIEHENVISAQPYPQYEQPQPELIAPLIVEQPEMLDEPAGESLDDSLDLENPESPSDLLDAPAAEPSPRVPKSPSRSMAPAKPATPPRSAAPTRKPEPQTPPPAEADEDLLLDLPEDSDGLIDELPPPARDPLSPENSTYYPRPTRRRTARIAQTSAETPVSRPTTIGNGFPQRLPQTR